jgi:hypothetical protein
LRRVPTRSCIANVIEYAARLQGGPHDGATQRIIGGVDVAPRFYVKWCKRCKELHWHVKPEPKTETYRHDGADGEWELYVYTDTHLAKRLGIEAEQEEKVPA